MATHSSILARSIPWAEEPGRLWSIGPQSWTRLKWLSMHARTKARNSVTGHELISMTSFSKMTHSVLLHPWLEPQLVGFLG